MSDRIPPKEADRVAWAREHATLWAGGQGGPPNIGVTAQQVANFDTAVTDTEAKRAAKRAAATAAKAATEAKDDSLEEMNRQISALVATIDAHALATQDPGVYQRAGLTPPKDPSERSAPPQPIVKTPVQLSGGIVRVEFTVTTGGGAQYLVQRADTRLDNTTTNWFPVGTVTEKFFRDEAIPFGLRQVQYRVAAQISSGPVSEWSEPATFSFGTQGSQAGPMAKAPGTLGSIEPVKPEDQKGAG